MSANNKPERSRPGSVVKPYVIKRHSKQPQANGGIKYFETRRNCAACFRTKNIDEPHYFGIAVIENLPEQGKISVSIAVREIRSGPRAGQKYLSVSLRPFSQERSKKE